MEKELMSLALLLLLVGSFMFDTKVSVSSTEHCALGNLEEKHKLPTNLNNPSLIRDVFGPAKSRNIVVSYINHASQAIAVQRI